jgi:hypothetical protein
MSDANLTKLLFAAEAAFAETPDLASTLQELRFTSESLAHTKETVVSEEIRSDRARADLVQVGLSAEGSIETEMILGAYNDLILAALLASAWTTGQDTGLTLTSDITGQTFTATVGTFSSATQAAKLIKIAGMTAPALNRVYTVVSCTSTVLTVADGQITVDEGPTASATADYKYARNGTTLSTFLLEKQFMGVSPAHYVAMIGGVVNELGINLEARAIASMSIGLMGARLLDSAATFGDGSPTGVSSNKILNTTENVATLYVDGVALTANVMTFDMALNNNLRERPAIANLFTLEHGKGTIDLTGTLDTYFEDAALLTAFLDHDSAEVLVPLYDADGNAMTIHLPEIKFINGSPQAEGINTDVMLPLEYQALLDAALGYVVQIDQIDA